jgi:hypothetical protein
MWQNKESSAYTEVTSPMLSDMRQQLSEYEDRAEKLGRRL